MISTLTFVTTLILTILFGVYIGLFIAAKYYSSRKFSKETDYKGLYLEAVVRLKNSVKESNLHSSIIMSLSEQLNWQRLFTEHIILHHNMTEEQVYKIVKQVNDSLGRETPSMEEMKESVNEIMKLLTENLGEFDQEKALVVKKPPKVELNLDSILEKISQDGISSLTDDERKFLNNQ